MSNCIHCGKELLANAKFCKFCGTSQNIPISDTPQQTPVKPVCSKCGTSLTSNAKFCKHCGAQNIQNLEPNDSLKTMPPETSASVPIDALDKGNQPEAVSNKLKIEPEKDNNNTLRGCPR